jgi:hypothetical protein
MRYSDGRGFESRQEHVYSLLSVVQTGSGSHPASHPMRTGTKQPGREADHSPSSAEVKNDGDLPPLPHAPSWRGY